MKKWVIIGLVAVCMVIVLFTTAGEEKVEVKTIRIVPERAEQTVACTGLVEAKSSTPFAMPFPCVLEKILVKAGQRVKCGDVIAIIDKEASRDLVLPEMLVALAATESEISAPADGVILSVDGVAGETLAEGTPCVVMVCDRDLQVRVAIPEKHLQNLAQGMAVRVTGVGFDKSLYSGSLTEIAATAQADMGGGTVVQGVVSLDAPDASLRVGLNARVTVITVIEESALVLPYEAVLADEQGQYAYVVQGGRAHRVPITESVQVEKGLLVKDTAFEGASVIVQPEKITAEGQAIREVVA